MPDTFRDTLATHLEALKNQVRAAEAALEAYDRKTPRTQDIYQPTPERPFSGLRHPYVAIKSLLIGAGGRMNREELLRKLVAGGATDGKARGIHNLRISIDTNVNLKKLAIRGDDVVLLDKTPGATVGPIDAPERSKR